MGTGPLEYIVESERNYGLKLTMEGNAVNYREADGRQLQVKCHFMEQIEDAERKASDWKQKLDITPDFNAYGDQFIGMDTKFQYIWDRYYE